MWFRRARLLVLALLGAVVGLALAGRTSAAGPQSPPRTRCCSVTVVSANGAPVFASTTRPEAIQRQTA